MLHIKYRRWLQIIEGLFLMNVQDKKGSIGLQMYMLLAYESDMNEYTCSLIPYIRLFVSE